MIKFWNKPVTPKAPHEMAWFRITVVVVSAGICAGKGLIWLGL